MSAPRAVEYARGIPTGLFANDELDSASTVALKLSPPWPWR
jgi:hypothetical protein